MFAPLLLLTCEPDRDWVSPAQVCEWYDEEVASYPDVYGDDPTLGEHFNYWCGESTDTCDDAGNIRVVGTTALQRALAAHGCVYDETCVDAELCKPQWPGTIDCGDAGHARYWLCYVSEP